MLPSGLVDLLMIDYSTYSVNNVKIDIHIYCTIHEHDLNIIVN